MNTGQTRENNSMHKQKVTSNEQNLLSTKQKFQAIKGFLVTLQMSFLSKTSEIYRLHSLKILWRVLHLRLRET